MTELQDVFTDLVGEGDALDRVVADLDRDAWRTPTPAPGWTVAHQIAHLTFIAELAHLAAATPERFAAATAGSEVPGGFQAAIEAGAAERLGEPGPMLGRWRAARAGAAGALRAISPDGTVPWLVNPIPPSVLAAAGLMELFAHGQDVADALGVRREYTDRLGHVAWFGARVWTFGYEYRGLTPPRTRFRFELTAPSGAQWVFGPEDAEQLVCGPAVDFCLLITRRRHHADLALKTSGDEAEAWLEIAQAYRGPAGEGRRQGQFTAA